MFISLYDTHIQDKQLDAIVGILENDGIVVIPTDTLFAFVCDIQSHKAAKKLAQIKGKTLEKSNFSLLCKDLSQASQYVKPLSKEQFSLIKNVATGGFTFVLPSSNLTPKIFLSKKRTIGIRIPEHNVAQEILQRINRPLLVSSLPHDEDMEEDFFTNAELIYDTFSKQVEAVVECNAFNNSDIDCSLKNIPSTVIDMTDSQYFSIIRQGLGEIEL